MLIDQVQSAPVVPSDEKPYPQSTGHSQRQRRSDQYFDGETHITDSVTGAEVGHVFGSRSVVVVNGVPRDKWTEVWVITDPVKYKSTANVSLDFTYVDADTDSDSFIIDKKQSVTPPPPLLRADMDFFYEDFPKIPIPSDAFPSSVPAGLGVMIFDVFTRDSGGGEALSGTLFRMIDDNPPGAADTLHIDHWILYNNYGAPTDNTTITILRQRNDTPFTDVEDMAKQAPAEDPTQPDKPHATWHVRTQALYKVV